MVSQSFWFQYWWVVIHKPNDWDSVKCVFFLAKLPTISLLMSWSFDRSMDSWVEQTYHDVFPSCSPYSWKMSGVPAIYDAHVGYTIDYAGSIYICIHIYIYIYVYIHGLRTQPFPSVMEPHCFGFEHVPFSVFHPHFGWEDTMVCRCSTPLAYTPGMIFEDCRCLIPGWRRLDCVQGSNLAICLAWVSVSDFTG